MSAPGFARSLAALAVTALAASAWGADEPEAAARPLTPEQCERLVERLANSNKPPFAENYVLDLPDGVTTSGLYQAQKPIADAYNRLSAEIEVSLPALAAHVADRRFSYVYEDGISGVYQRATVGGACTRIIEKHLDVYREAVTKYDADGRSKSLWFDYDKFGGFEKWWTDRRGRSLADLQLEWIEWAAGQPKPKHLSSREWVAARKALGRMAEKIRASKKPIPVEHKVRFFSK